jgi:hypothetical protein
MTREEFESELNKYPKVRDSNFQGSNVSCIRFGDFIFFLQEG